MTRKLIVAVLATATALLGAHAVHAQAPTTVECAYRLMSAEDQTKVANALLFGNPGDEASTWATTRLDGSAQLCRDGNRWNDEQGAASRQYALSRTTYQLAAAELGSVNFGDGHLRRVLASLSPQDRASVLQGTPTSALIKTLDPQLAAAGVSKHAGMVFKALHELARIEAAEAAWNVAASKRK